MGAGHSEFDEIEDAIRKVLHDRKAAQELSSEKQSELKRREDEYQDDLQKLSSKLEVAMKKTKEAAAILHIELNQTLSALREQIQLYHGSNSGNECPTQFNVGLFGNTGVGKTSLLNSLKFAVRGKLDEIMKEQVAPADYHGGHTTLRLPVGITNFVTFIDNRGIGPEDLETESAIEELMRQLEGKASFTKPVDWRTPNQQVANKPANTSKRIFCSILVIDARNVETIGPHGESFLQCLLRWHGRYPITVITHVDVATPKELEDIHHAIKSTGITELYEVANITDERPELEVEYQSSLLRLLERCITNCHHTLEYRKQLEK